MKKVWRILSIIVAVVLALGMTVFAEKSVVIGGTPSTQNEDGVVIQSYVADGKVTVSTGESDSDESAEIIEVPESEAVYTFSAATGQVGEIVDVKLNFKTTTPASLVAVGPITYDSNVLEIVGFTYDSSVTSLINEQLSSFDLDKKALVILFNEDNNYDVCLGTLQFRIKDDLETENITSKNNNEESSEDAETAKANRKKDVIVLKIDSSTAYTFGKTAMIDPDNSSVVPYIKNDRTLVPLRFVSETLGADVQWENGWNYCYVVKGDKKIKITFNSADIEVNGEVITYDAPVEVVENRTMVPVRFISEELGYDVKWNQANQLVIITPADNPWIEDGQVENDVLEGILVTFLFNGVF